MYNLNDQHFLKITYLMICGQKVFYILSEKSK